jgi:hypothetical protein
MAIDQRYLDQTQAYIGESLKAEIPTLTVDGGSAVNSVLMRGASVIVAPLKQEVDHVIETHDLTDPEALSKEDFDVILGNLLVERDKGDFSQTFIDIHYADRVQRSFAQGLRASTSDRVKVYATTSDLVFDVQDYFVDPSDGTFYLRVPVTAQEAGPEFDVDVGEINTLLDSQSGVLYVRNSSDAVGGLAEQTNTQALRTANRSVSTRVPDTLDGTIVVLQKLFGQKLLDAVVVGNGDVDMIRDELYDMGEGEIPRWTLGPSGTPSGIHLGGRSDVYNWYPSINFIEETVDLGVDLTFLANQTVGVNSFVAKFAAGTTTTNTVPASGKLVLELGSSIEETVSYSSFTFNGSLQQYTFTLTAPTQFAHQAEKSIKVAGNGQISIGPAGRIKAVLPIIRVASVVRLDPLTLAPIGDPIPEVDPDSREPGWYFEDINELIFMSAKETRTLHIDEKLTHLGNPALAGTTAVTSQTPTPRDLVCTAVDFTGYQGRDITITTTGGTVTRTILQVISATEVQYSDGPEDPIPSESSVSFSIEANTGDFVQYPIRVSYYSHTKIGEAQAVFDGGRIRVVTQDNLSHAFFPVFLDFTMNYKGSGSEEDVRKALLNVLQTAQGTTLGANSGTKFEVSDLVDAAYDGNLTDGVETPFEIKVTTINRDGTKSVKWVSPGPNTVNELVIASTSSPGDKIVTCTRPAQVAAFTIPTEGKLYLGAFVGTQETLTYDKVIFSGSNIIFILSEGESVGFSHPSSEPMRVSVLDFDPANVITDGVITSSKLYRPYFGTVIVNNNS